MTKPKILFICKDRNTNTYHEGKYGLYNSSTFVCETLHKIGYTCKVITVFDANCIDKEITAYKPDVVILEALWAPPYKIRELTKISRHKNIKWIVRIHSKGTFLANEGIAFDWINEYNKINNVTISTNNAQFNNDMVSLGYDSEYLPNIYYVNYGIERLKVKDDYIDIGCFGSIRPMKNHLQQAIVAIEFANYMDRPLRFHINSSRYEQNGNNVLKNLRALFRESSHKLIEHDWLSHYRFCELVASMDIGMQVSLTESFNIVSADFVNTNVPIITCSDITFVSSLYHAIQTDSTSIFGALLNAWYGDYINLQRINKWHLNAYNKHALRTWIRYLNCAISKH
jgi:hypothetical protein